MFHINWKREEIATGKEIPYSIIGDRETGAYVYQDAETSCVFVCTNRVCVKLTEPKVYTVGISFFNKITSQLDIIRI